MPSSEDRPVQFDQAARERRLYERRMLSGSSVTRVELAPPVARVAWSGVWAGFLISLGIWLVLAALGAAVGMSNISGGLSTGAAIGKATTAWLYVSALVALFFGAAFGARLAMVVDGTVAWLEATLIWTFALVLTTIAAGAILSVAAVHPVAARDVIQANPAVATTGAIRAGAWLTFIGIVVAWIAAVLGSFWGRAQARGRAHQLGLAA